MNIVSRGGSLVFAWMSMTGEENPFYEYYDEILDICEEYDVTISLGDACRPGCLADATDVCQIEELVRLGELTKRAWDHNVQVMVEGPGHVPLDQVAANMKVQSRPSAWERHSMYSDLLLLISLLDMTISQLPSVELLPL